MEWREDIVMRLGILGTGMIVRDLLTTMGELPVDELAILGRPASREKTEALAAQYGIGRRFYDYGALLESDVDTVYVALPNSLHFSFAKRALEAGKHVIVEKPATANFRELETLRELAARKRLILTEAMNIHYLPAFRALREDVRKLGELKIVSLNYSQYSSRYDAFKSGTVLPAFDPHQAGGALMDLNVYNVHTVVGLFGRPGAVHYLANLRRGIDTSGILTLDYGGFKAVCIGAKDCQAPILSTFQGDGGSLLIRTPVNRMCGYTLVDSRGNQRVRDFDDGRHRLYHAFAGMLRMIGQRDFAKAEELLDMSCAVSRILEEARRQAGIVFDNDE